MPRNDDYKTNDNNNGNNNVYMDVERKQNYAKLALIVIINNKMEK